MSELTIRVGKFGRVVKVEPKAGVRDTRWDPVPTRFPEPVTYALVLGTVYVYSGGVWFRSPVGAPVGCGKLDSDALERMVATMAQLEVEVNK
jgi:hypothetical protein